jgi:hypothetical protein
MGTNASNPEDNFGLLHQDFTPRPSYAAFTRAMQAEGGAGTQPAPTGTETTPTTTETTRGSPKPNKKKARSARLRYRRRSAPSRLLLVLRRVGKGVVARGVARRRSLVDIHVTCPSAGRAVTVSRLVVRASARGHFRHRVGFAGRLRGCEVVASAAGARAAKTIRLR